MRQRFLWFLNDGTIVFTAIVLLAYVAILPTNLISNQ